MTDQKPTPTIVLPEGRLINHSLFAKDQYNDKAKPAYKVELAFPKGTLNDFYNQCLDAAVEKWGESAESDKNMVMPIKDGDVMVAKREKEGKSGPTTDVYVGMEVIRANTIYNKHGEDGPGGSQVYGPDVQEIEAVNQSEVYRGCYGKLALVIGTYTDSKTGANALTLYISAFQKTKDGERLVSQTDHSKHFEPVVIRGGKEGDGRRSRKG